MTCRSPSGACDQSMCVMYQECPYPKGDGMRTPHGLMQGSDQELAWAGDFGSEYTRRNRVEWEKRVPFWRMMLQITQARSVLDVGCNAGWNLRAIRAIDKDIWGVGVDVNNRAVVEARTEGLDAVVIPVSGIAIHFPAVFDIVCTSGVLIHVAPARLQEAMQNIVDASKRWVLAVEYESDKEEEVVYRGNTDRLWKRPFGKLYQAMGLEVMAQTDADGFDQCRAWLLQKPLDNPDMGLR